MSVAERLTATSSWMSSRCQAASCASAACSTQRVRLAEVPVCSAMGMNSTGDTRPNTGCRQRTSASTPVTHPSDMRVLGWNIRNNDPPSSASGRSAPSVRRRRWASSCDRAKLAMLVRCEIAASTAACAQRSASAAVLPSLGASATPSWTVACSVMPAVVKGALECSLICCATAAASTPSGSSIATAKAALSSRATSPRPSFHAESCCARWLTTRSAISNPSVAEISCRLVTTSWMTPSCDSIPGSCSRCVSHSSSCDRLGSPVAPSCRATCSSWVSRSAMPLCMLLNESARCASSRPPEASTRCE